MTLPSDSLASRPRMDPGGLSGEARALLERRAPAAGGVHQLVYCRSALTREAPEPLGAEWGEVAWSHPVAARWSGMAILRPKG